MSISVNTSSIDLKNGLQQNVIVVNDGASTENVTLTNAVSGVKWSDDDGANWNTGNDSFSLDAAAAGTMTNTDTTWDTDHAIFNGSSSVLERNSFPTSFPSGTIYIRFKIISLPLNDTPLVEIPDSRGGNPVIGVTLKTDGKLYWNYRSLYTSYSVATTNTYNDGGWHEAILTTVETPFTRLETDLEGRDYNGLSGALQIDTTLGLQIGALQSSAYYNNIHVSDVKVWDNRQTLATKASTSGLLFNLAWSGTEFYNTIDGVPGPAGSETYKFKYENSATLSIPSQVSFAGTNTEDIYCDVKPSENFGSVSKGACSAIYTIEVENIDTSTRTVSGIVAPTGFECKKSSDTTWVSNIPTFDILASASEDIQFRSCTSEIGTVEGSATLSYNPTIAIALSVTSLAGDFKVSYIDTHVATAQGRLIRQYRQGSNVEQICAALVGPLQQTEDDTYDLYSAWDIDTQEGVNLDRIGAIIGQDRSGFDDDTYRIFLKGQVGINNSRGTLNDILSLWNIFNPGATIKVNEQYPAQIELLTSATQSTQQIQDFIFELMDQAAQAGVRVVWILPITVEGDGFFKFDSTSSLDSFDNGIFSNKLNT